MRSPFIVDETRVFKLGSNPAIRTLRVGRGKHKVVVVDDFYANPALVRDLVLRTPATNSKEIVNYSPGYRCVATLDLSGPLKAIGQLLKRNFRDTYAAAGLDAKGLYCNFTGNLLTTKAVPSVGQVCPHWDPNAFVGIAYLNTKAESRGGTAFYEHKATRLQRIPAHESQLLRDQQKLSDALARCNLTDAKELRRCLLEGNEFYSEYMSDSNEHWELIEMIPMKFNRLVLYEGNLFHSAYLKREWFKTHFRLAQLFAF